MRATRRYLTAFLLNVDLDANNMSVSTLIEILDHFSENPNDYHEYIRRTQSTEVGPD